jgi:signal transduction protein with GAF and PtsI domain
MALVNLARIVDRGPTVADVASVAWSQIRHLAPGASCGVFLNDKGTDSVTARFVAGPASQVLQGLHMKVGERMTGWVAGHAQPIVNSEAALDLGSAAGLAHLTHGLAVPLVHDGDVVGVLTLYAPDAFDDEQAQAVQVVAPHLAQMFAAVTAPAHEAPKAAPFRSRSAVLRVAG